MCNVNHIRVLWLDTLCDCYSFRVFNFTVLKVSTPCGT